MDDYIKRSDALNAVVGYDNEESIKAIPAADVRPVKRGEWDKNSDVAFFWKCSECGCYVFWRKEEFLINGDVNFCTACGADMRQKEEP